ncbi:Hypothetical protein R9X50_00771400 [Acrodontium crateriforme]|uniref:Uncharacterized protein n=1 Tax=Acrodontium crateriforme TaxID=150365 RepID=A0AAQ3ME38_9PEZI|nr:Hypothetical protein R9X50_00771400 [Acrodontium crateriforme]
MANIYSESYEHPFQLSGSLDQPRTEHIGPYARESLVDFNGSKMLPIGPLSSSPKLHESSSRLILSLILRKEIYADRPIDGYLIHLLLLELIPAINANSQNSRHFLLKHPNDKGDQVLLNVQVVGWANCWVSKLPNDKSVVYAKRGPIRGTVK